MACALIAAAALTCAVPAAAGAWGYGSNSVKSAAESKSHDPGATIAYGPGWVELSYKWNGPMVGYLFAPGFTFENGVGQQATDMMDIRGASKRKAEGVNEWPWGYAQGHFNGCAYAYGGVKFKVNTKNKWATNHCKNGPSVQIDPGQPKGWHSETVFCRDKSKPFCSPKGVYSAKKTGGLGKAKAGPGGCQAWANIGSAAVYGSAAPNKQDYVGVIPEGQPIDVRYSTKSDMSDVKWTSHRLPTAHPELAWVFVDRTCLRAR